MRDKNLMALMAAIIYAGDSMAAATVSSSGIILKEIDPPNVPRALDKATEIFKEIVLRSKKSGEKA